MNHPNLRILAYHQVARVDRFADHMAHLVRDYHPVDAEAVVRGLRGKADLPHSAVWVTFDDGHPNVIESALPVMLDYGISGTMFVCPGLIDTSLPYWWEIVDTAFGLGETWELNATRFDSTNVGAFKTTLKAIADVQRRAIVRKLADAVTARLGHLPQRRQVTTSQLERFIAAGGYVGNHSWDHPCLDTCRDSEVKNQIVRADDWLARFGGEQRLFAYPNGNHSPAAEAVLAELGYDVGLLFDHRLVSRTQSQFRLSRLRVNDDTTLDRFAAIVAGVHPAIHRVRKRLSAKVR